MDIIKIVDSLLDNLGLSYTDTIGGRSKLLCVDVIEALILSSSMKEASVLLDITEDTLEQSLRRNFSKLIEKTNKCKWDLYLLSLLDLRKCSVCNEIHTIDIFSSDKSICKPCDALKNRDYRSKNIQSCRLRSREHYYANKDDYLARNANRRAQKIQRTPKWADLDKIRKIYQECKLGYHVDHIIPLQGKLVSGLHVENNLQYLMAEENLKKHNKYTGE